MIDRTLKSLLLGAMLAATGSVVQAATLPSFVADGELSVCTDPTFPPLEFFEKAGDKEPVGFDTDFVRALATHWKVKPRFIPSEFTGLLPALSSGRCDLVVSGTFITPERQKNYTAIPYFSSSSIIVGSARKDFSIKSPLELSDKVVAVQSGTLFLTHLQTHNEELKGKGLPEIKIQTYPKQNEAIQQVILGRAVAAPTQDVEAAYRELQMPGELKTLYTYPDGQTFGVYLRPNAADQQGVSEAIAELGKDGTLKAIAEKWKMSPDSLVQPQP